ncbi:MAG: hypothetical protein ACK47B_07450 [Armatimonadota bacterium]
MDEEDEYPRCPACGLYLLPGEVTDDLLQDLKRERGWTIGNFDRNAPPETWDAVFIGGSTLWKCPRCQQRVNRPSHAERLAGLRELAEQRDWFKPGTVRTMERIAAVVRGESVLCEVCHQPLFFVGPDTPPPGDEWVHPGVYCENDCTRIILEYRPEEPDRPGIGLSLLPSPQRSAGVEPSRASVVEAEERRDSWGQARQRYERRAAEAPPYPPAGPLARLVKELEASGAADRFWATLSLYALKISAEPWGKQTRYVLVGARGATLRFEVDLYEDSQILQQQLCGPDTLFQTVSAFLDLLPYEVQGPRGR